MLLLEIIYIILLNVTRMYDFTCPSLHNNTDEVSQLNQVTMSKFTHFSQLDLTTACHLTLNISDLRLKPDNKLILN